MQHSTHACMLYLQAIELARAQSANDAIITACSANRMCMHAGLLHLKSCTHKPVYCKNNAHAHCMNQRKDSIISSHSTHSPLCSRTSTVDPPVQWHTATNLGFICELVLLRRAGVQDENWSGQLALFSCVEFQERLALWL